MAEAERESVVKPRRKRSTQREMAMRDARLIRALATGQSIEELAAQEGVSLRRARERVSAILSRTADPPAEFAQLQIRRLNEAMIVAYASLKVGDPRSIDTVIKLTREFDRYAGLAQAVAPFAPPAAPALAPPPLSLPPPAPARQDEATPSEAKSE
jgi:hypothetical protein